MKESTRERLYTTNVKIRYLHTLEDLDTIQNNNIELGQIHGKNNLPHRKNEQHLPLHRFSSQDRNLHVLFYSKGSKLFLGRKHKAGKNS